MDLLCDLWTVSKHIFGPRAGRIWEKNCNLLLFLILASFADEELPLDADGAEILSETFNILGLKEMKLQAISSAAGGAAGEEPEEEEEKMATMAKAVLHAAQKKVVSQVSSIGQGTGKL